MTKTAVFVEKFMFPQKEAAPHFTEEYAVNQEPAMNMYYSVWCNTVFTPCCKLVRPVSMFFAQLDADYPLYCMSVTCHVGL